MRDPSQPRPDTFEDAVRLLGMDKKVEWTRQDIADLRELMKVDNPLREMQFIRSVSMSKSVEGFTETDVRQVVQDMLDILPVHIAVRLPDIGISFVDTIIDNSDKTNGTYDRERRVIEVTTWNMKDLRVEELRRELRRVLSHEVMHWLHLSCEGEAADAYRKAITDHYDARMKNGSDGQWYKSYAKRNYEDVEDEMKIRGFEVPTTYYELWLNPADLAAYSSLKMGRKAIAFRETFYIINSIFNQR
jgi:hypothetical protein